MNRYKFLYFFRVPELSNKLILRIFFQIFYKPLGPQNTPYSADLFTEIFFADTGTDFVEQQAEAEGALMVL